MESMNEGVKLSEAELEERRQELLAKAEIQSGETEELDDPKARKLLALFEKRLKSNQQLRIKYLTKPEKFMKVRLIKLNDIFIIIIILKLNDNFCNKFLLHFQNEIELFGLIQDLRTFATQPHLYALLWDETVCGGLSLSNLISLTSHENGDIAGSVVETLHELIDQVKKIYKLFQTLRKR